MKILWNKVTWYSQMIAIVLFVAVFLFGMWLGEQKQKSGEFTGPDGLIQSAAKK